MHVYRRQWPITDTHNIIAFAPQIRLRRFGSCAVYKLLYCHLRLRIERVIRQKTLRKFTGKYNLSIYTVFDCLYIKMEDIRVEYFVQRRCLTNKIERIQFQR